VAASLLISGLLTILYGGFLPVPDWLSFRIEIPVLGSPPVALLAGAWLDGIFAVVVLFGLTRRWPARPDGTIAG
jgi:hypothetical protein